MKIWITVSTFNRKKITEKVITRLSEIKKDHFLHVSDDYSTDYTITDLNNFGADLVERPATKMGIHSLRFWELKKFLETDYDLCYLTDNDAMHDPSSLDVLIDIYSETKKPVSIYNTRWHLMNTLKIEEKYSLRKTIPGISQLYDREMIKKIVSYVDRYGAPTYAWDYVITDWLKPEYCVTSNISYIEHYGVGGLHNVSLTDFDRDRALNPTAFLAAERLEIIKYLTT